MDERARLRAERIVLGYMDNLKTLEILYADTGNPLFIWDAIAVLNYLRSLGPRGFKVPDLPPVPEWAVSYIAQTAVDLTKLANGELTSGTGSPVSRVPHALGLVSQRGSNKFVEYRAMRRDIDIADRAEQLRKEGMTSAEVDELLKQEFGDKDHSVIQKRKTSGKRLRERITKLVTKTVIE